MQTAVFYNSEISIRKQQMRVNFDVDDYKEYKISTSKFGVGFELDSNKPCRMYPGVNKRAQTDFPF